MGIVRSGDCVTVRPWIASVRRPAVTLDMSTGDVMPDFLVLRIAKDGQAVVMPYADGRGGATRVLHLDDEGEPVSGLSLVSLELQGDAGLVIDARDIEPARVAVERDQLVVSTSGAEAKVPPAEIGIDDAHLSDVQALSAKREDRSKLGLVTLRDNRVSVVWIEAGGAAGWLAERDLGRERKDRAKKRAARAGALRSQRDRFRPDTVRADDVFVNPYTFVPLPDVVTRSRPRGHASLGDDGLSGWFDVCYTFGTEYVLPQDHPGMPPDGAELEIPGSTVKGAVRSVHEVLAGGCLRVFQADLLPVHREVQVDHGKWMLAVVEDVDAVSGEVRSVLACEEVVWIESHHLLVRLAAGVIHSGMRVSLDQADTGEPSSAISSPQGPRRVLHKDVQVHAVDESGQAQTPNGEWVLHLTDPNARLQGKPYYAAAGRVGSVRRELEPGAWEKFRVLAEDGADAVKARRIARDAGREKPADTHNAMPGHPGWPGVDVVFPRNGATIGRRRATDGWLGRGDTVWVNAGRGQVNSLKPALLWRMKGASPAGERVDRSLLPCTDPDDLCPTCEVFGSAEVKDSTADRGRTADAGRRKRRESRQRSYGAHVRFSPLRSDGKVTSRATELPPLGSPRPGSGMFYLSHRHLDEQARDEAFAPQTHPLSYWGSALDRGVPRRLAGRKFYWHGQDPQPFPRHVKRPGASETQTRTAHVVAAGTTCRGRVWFDNLTAAQVGLLLAAATPGLALDNLDGGHTAADRTAVLADRTFAVHLGGGRPLGYGTVVPSIADGSLTVHTAASRYAGQAPPTMTVADYMEAARQRCYEGRPYDGHPFDAPDTWRALASVLAVDRVPAERLWYPPARYWSQRTTNTRSGAGFNETFDESYTLFSECRGGGMGDLKKMRPMEALPAATDVDQSLPIVPKR